MPEGRVATRRIGSIVASKYRLDAELGRGGMGAVYRAHHLRVRKDFAIKVLHSEVLEHRTILSRFMLEAQAAGRIGHSGVLDVYDVGEDDDGSPFIVMELLQGEALSALLRRERIELDAACWIAIQVLDVLAAAHEAGVIHRDVKPQNVFITEKGSGPPSSQRGVKLLDFGIAKFAPRTSNAPPSTPQEDVAGDDSVAASALTRSGEIIGSPLYMAPEQARGEADLDARADVWSVGAMLFEMLTGRCAHAATTPVAVLAKILTEPAPPPSTRDKGKGITPELDGIVQKALKIDRAERYESARAMRDAILEVRRNFGTADQIPPLPRPEKVPQPASSSPRSRNDLAAGVVTSTVAAPPPPTSARPKKRASDPPLESAVTKNELGVPSHPKTSRIVAAVALAVGVGIAVFWVTQQKKTAVTTDSLVGSTSALPVVSTPSTPTEIPSAAPSTSPSASASTFLSASASAGTVSRPVRAATSAPLTASPPARPKCETHEVLSNGHCCAKGLEWQNGKCERPLATTF